MESAREIDVVHRPVVLRRVVGALDSHTPRAEIKIDVTRRARNVHIPNIRVASVNKTRGAAWAVCDDEWSVCREIARWGGVGGRIPIEEWDFDCKNRKTVCCVGCIMKSVIIER
jgi:hypothetical protein